MIIGISGKIGAGKDTVGSIIQYLTWSEENQGDSALTYEEFLGEKFDQDAFDWKIRKFADKLKETVCLLTGCTREQLENIDFKNSNLPNQWNKPNDKFEFLNSYELAEKYGYIHNDSLNPTPTRKSSKNEKEFEESIDKAILDGWTRVPTKFSEWSRRIGESTPMTYREILQKVGTEAMRGQVHENVWINALFADYKCTINGVYGNGRVVNNDDYPKWIITDMRFPNELVSVKERRGITIRVNRIQGLYFLDTQTSQLNPAGQHPSEIALDSAEFDYTIDNNGTIEELAKKIREILTKEKII